MEEKRLGVIGGSGLYQIKGLEGVKEVRVDTPFGEPSDDYILGTLEGVPMVFLPRHGRGHRLLPSELNYRANIYGMKKLGVEWIISVSAVGSMREDIRPGDILIPNQFFDRTSKRISTFFGNGIVAHVAFADPVCPKLSSFIFSAGKELRASIHMGGTYMCMEGPQFSTRAESNIYRIWGVDVIGMTNIPEAKLAREAEICYATMALITDYDCWHEHEEDVTIEAVIAIMNKNTELAQQIIQGVVKKIPKTRDCICATALKDAILTPPEYISAQAKENLNLIIGKYMPKKD